MFFNLDPTKKVQQSIFSQKENKIEHPSIYFNDAPVAKTNCQKHLGMCLDEKLNFYSAYQREIFKS